MTRASREPETLGAFLRRRREQAHMTAGHVALASRSLEKSSRISQSYLSEIENNGKMPSPQKLLTLARLLGITIAEIYEVLGAAPEETGVEFEARSAARRLYPNPVHRGIHRDIQSLLDYGLEAPLHRLTDEFRMLIDEQRRSMMQVIRDHQAEAACVLAGGHLLLDFNLTAQERKDFAQALKPSTVGWISFCEGGADDFQVILFLKNPTLLEPEEATIVVPLVRWWAGLQSVMRRLERISQ